MDYSPARYRSQSPLQVTRPTASVTPQSPGFTICAIDQTKLYAEIDKIVPEEYMRVKKLHTDPRKAEGNMNFEQYKEVEKAVKTLMETYVKKRFPGEMGLRKPFDVWKELKDAEDLIRARILQEHLAEQQALRAKQQEDAKLTRVKSKHAIKVIPTQRWQSVKARQNKLKKSKEMARQADETTSATKRQAKAKEEYKSWLLKKVTQSRETALNQRKERLVQQQMKAEQEMKAHERAEYSYQQWLERKKYETVRESRAEQGVRKEDSQRLRTKPVLLAYSVNRKGLSKELWTELSMYGRQEGSYASSRSAGTGKQVRRRDVYEEEGFDSELGSNELMPPIHLPRNQLEQSDSGGHYEDDYEEEDYEEPQQRHSAGLERRQALAFEYPLGPQREVTFQERGAANQGRPHAQWQDEGSSLDTEDDQQVGFVEESDYSLEDT